MQNLSHSCTWSQIYCLILDLNVNISYEIILNFSGNFLTCPQAYKNIVFPSAIMNRLRIYVSIICLHSSFPLKNKLHFESSIKQLSNKYAGNETQEMCSRNKHIWGLRRRYYKTGVSLLLLHKQHTHTQILKGNHC